MANLNTNKREKSYAVDTRLYKRAILKVFELSQVVESLMQNQEEQKEELLNALSHELRTPLTTLSAFSQILKKCLEQSGDTNALYYVTEMDKQLKKLSFIITDFMDIRRLESKAVVMQKKNFDLNKLINNSIEYVQPLLKQRIIKFGSVNRYVCADEKHISQAFMNLLLNAAKNSSSEDIIMITFEEGKEYIKIGVQDFGLGFNKYEKEFIFKNFFHNAYKNETYPNLNLGLFLAAQIISNNNGRIWVESKEGKGSTFFFTLPTNVVYE